MMHDYVVPTVTRMFELSEIEIKIFDYLMKVVRNKCDDVILRVAGGWVRDKILGIDSDDIDIVLNMTGKGFAKFLAQQMIEDGSSSCDICIIDSNPVKSKHLEVATMKLFGVQLDFVNLRTESYNESRIPQIKIGTALEDSFRRDLTINSLFYNISTDRIEDYTGRGLNDINNKIIDTPLEPMQTFLDDPLRILRSIRFASKLQFNFHNRIIEAVDNHKIREALLNKVSRERIGVEIMKMLNGKYPYTSIRLIYDFNLYPIIFRLPNYDLNVKRQEYDVIKDILLIPKMHNELLPETILAALLIHYHDVKYINLNGKYVPIIKYILSNSLKLSNHTTNIILTMVNNFDGWRQILLQDNEPTRLQLGIQMIATERVWCESLIVSWIYCKFIHPSNLFHWTTIVNLINIYDLNNSGNSYNMRPIFNGKQIIETFDIVQGPDVGIMLNIQRKWMLENGVIDENREKFIFSCEEFLREYQND